MQRRRAHGNPLLTLVAVVALAALSVSCVAGIGGGTGAEDSLDGDLAAFATAPDESSIPGLADRIGESGNTRYVPYLVDLLRLFSSPLAAEHVRSAFTELTGVELEERYSAAHLRAASWLLETTTDPGSDYIEWKAALYADRLDEPLGALIAQIRDPVLAARLTWGGVGVGEIPELNNPKLIAGAEAAFLTDEETVFGAVQGAQARAYPLRFMDFHELANDTLNGEDIVVVNCTLCRSGTMFRRTVDGRRLDFLTSGLLLNSNKLMVDAQASTLWLQLSGEAIAGPLEGAILDQLFLSTIRWGDWLAEHPATEVLAVPQSGAALRALEQGLDVYEPGAAYGRYYEDKEGVRFPIVMPPDVFPPKALVATLVLDGLGLAVEVEALEEVALQVLRVGDRLVVAVSTRAGARFYLGSPGPADPVDLVAGELALTLPDGSELPRLQSSQSFWFAWHALHPDTDWWPR